MIKQTLAILVLLSASAPAWSSGINEFQFSTNIYMTKGSHLRHRAELGDAQAQYHLAWFYYQPENSLAVRGFPRDHRLAAKWYRRAAVQGHAGAQYNMAVLHLLGHGVKQDDLTAYAWANMAAKLGNANGEKLSTALAANISPDDVARAVQLQNKLVPARVRRLAES